MATLTAAEIGYIQAVFKYKGAVCEECRNIQQYIYSIDNTKLLRMSVVAVQITYLQTRGGRIMGRI